MKIIVQMGYVTRRKVAKLHLDIDGVAHCRSGGRRIITSGELTDASATKICRHCLSALRAHLSWRSDDLLRLGQLPAALNERVAINALLDALCAIEPDEVKADRVALITKIRGNVRRLATLEEPKRIKPYTSSSEVEIDENQISLF